MKYPTRRYFTQSDKTMMWDRWQKGESLNSIARLFDTSHSAISGVLVCKAFRERSEQRANKYAEVGCSATQGRG